MIKTNNFHKNEEGFASLVIALILIIILALLTTGFGQLARREQQTALDRQLSNQAYYAAESGVNDAVQYVQNTRNPSNVTTCQGLPSFSSSSVLNSSGDVRYTCVLVTVQPDTDYWTGVGADQDVSATFQPDTPPASPNDTINLHIRWTTADGNTNTPDLANLHPPYPQPFLPSNTWQSKKYPAVIQFSITPFDTNNTNRTTLLTNTYTTYFYPTNAGSDPTAPYNPTAQGLISDAKCSAGTCQASVNGIPYGSTNWDGTVNNTFLVHMTNYYDASNITIWGDHVSATGPSQFKFTKSQYMVDATGKARNVLKRIQVRIGSSPPGPSNAIKAGDVCKREQTAPTNTYNNAGTAFLNPDGSPGSGACDLEN